VSALSFAEMQISSSNKENTMSGMGFSTALRELVRRMGATKLGRGGLIYDARNDRYLVVCGEQMMLQVLASMPLTHRIVLDVSFNELRKLMVEDFGQGVLF